MWTLLRLAWWDLNMRQSEQSKNRDDVYIQVLKAEVVLYVCFVNLVGLKCF